MKNLITALIAAKANFAPILKDAANPQFKGKRYATLDAVLSAVEPALAAAGLTIVQTADLINGEPVLVTQLWHTSGECLSSTYLLSTVANSTEKSTSTIVTTVDDRGRETPQTIETKTVTTASNDPQKMGGAITYARRYAVCALLSITAEEDDDGNAASAKPQAQRPPAQAPKATPPKPAAKPVISGAQIGHLTKLATATGYTLEGLKELVSEYGFTARKAITLDVFEKLCAEAGDPELANAFNAKALEEVAAA